MDKQLEFTFDVQSLTFIHEPSGYIMTAQFLSESTNAEVYNDIFNNIGEEVEEYFIDALREIAEDFSAG